METEKVNSKYLDKAEELQEWIHKCVNGMMDAGSKAAYEDLYRTAVSLKIGEMMVRIEELENRNMTYGDNTNR